LFPFNLIPMFLPRLPVAATEPPGHVRGGTGRAARPLALRAGWPRPFRADVPDGRPLPAVP